MPREEFRAQIVLRYTHPDRRFKANRLKTWRLRLFLISFDKATKIYNQRDGVICEVKDRHLSLHMILKCGTVVLC